MNKNILAIDCSMDVCSVSIYKKKHIYSISEICKKTHAIKILPMIKKALLYTNITFQEIDYIACPQGPGNFTGMRISTGIAQSLSISLNIPVINISTFSMMAEKAWRKYKKKSHYCHSCSNTIRLLGKIPKK